MRMRFSIRTLLWLSLVPCVCGCAPDFGGNTQYTNLTYAQYASKVGLHEFDPEGAFDISFRGYSTIDSSDGWWRMKISQPEFDKLLKQMTSSMEDPAYVSYKSKRVGPLRKTTSGDPSIPGNWPKPDTTPPAWWKPPTNGQRLSVTRWELQVDNTSYDGRSKGWLWLYDPDAMMLWIWHWNYQHFDLGWSHDSDLPTPQEDGAS